MYLILLVYYAYVQVSTTKTRDVHVMSQKQKDLFAKGMVDLASIVAGALVFGQLVSGQVIDTSKMVLGITLAGVFYVGAFSFSNERRSSCLWIA
jgi:hypothetical protein